MQTTVKQVPKHLMKTLRFLGVMVLVILAGRPDRANAQVITTVIHRFNGNSDGGYPFGQVIRDSFGNLYGTTSTGGTNICFDGPCSSDFGTVFQINSAGAFTTLHRFSGQDGQNAYTGLVQGQDGNFYGTTFSGGTHNSGTVFQITSSGALTKLHDFADTPEGANPRDRLYQDTDGNFYGTTVHGGTNGLGTVFQMSSVGTVTTLYQFSGPDGAYPFKELVALQGVPGIFYGTTQNGGTNNNCLGGGCGTVFQITSAGTLTTLHQFGNPDDSTDGANPVCELVQGSDTNLYGTTQYGGTNGAGTVFRISPTGTLTTLYQFNGVTDGYRPFAVRALGRDANFHGTTVNGPSADFGSVFQITSDGSL